jgi:hypothetical protein
MKRPQITPGPWKACQETTRGEFVTETRIRSADDSHIAHVTPCAVEANARAIASVPALLEALELAETTIQRLAPNGSRATQGTRDVIAAALTLAGYEF